MISNIHPLPYVDKQDPWSSHSKIRDFLSSCPPGTTILDVGTASGTLARLCAGKGFVMRGIEPNPEWAKLCRGLYQAVNCTTLDQAPDEFLAGHDVVVCADVLEHMPDPGAALKRLVTLQQEGTCFLVSVPNVANLWVRLNLLFGRFEYAERGILDRTHLRFFTRRSFLKLLDASGLTVWRQEVTPIPLPLVHPFFEGNPIGVACYSFLANLTRMFPTLLGYQFIVMAEKQPNYGREPIARKQN